MASRVAPSAFALGSTIFLCQATQAESFDASTVASFTTVAVTFSAIGGTISRCLYSVLAIFDKVENVSLNFIDKVGEKVTDTTVHAVPIRWCTHCDSDVGEDAYVDLPPTPTTTASASYSRSPNR